MVCERCKKAQATVHLTNIRPTGEKIELHLCERCAMEEGLVPKPTLNLNEILASVVAGKAAASEMSELVCEECGMSYVEFRNQGLLGCPHDYETFKKPLMQMLEKAHDGASHHTGKRPRSQAAEPGAAPPPSPTDVRRLRKQLEEAVAAEDYERAAELRDRLRELEGKS